MSSPSEAREDDNNAATEKFDEFYKDLKETEKQDSVLTPKQQIDRLLRPGSTYRNLNPYEVLQVRRVVKGRGQNLSVRRHFTVRSCCRWIPRPPSRTSRGATVACPSWSILTRTLEILTGHRRPSMRSKKPTRCWKTKRPGGRSLMKSKVVTYHLSFDDH